MGPEIMQTAVAMTGIGACAIGLVAAVEAYTPAWPQPESSGAIVRPHDVTTTTDVAATRRRANARGAIIGTVYFSEDNNEDGLYAIDPVDGTAVQIGASGVTSDTVGLAPGATLGTLYGSRPRGLLLIDAEGSGSERLGVEAMEGHAYDRDRADLYAAGPSTEFFIIDVDDGTVVDRLPSPGVDVEGLAFGRGGVYGLAGSGTDTALYFYAVAEQAWASLGDTGVRWIDVGLAYDECADVLYAKGSQDAHLYTLDPATGTMLAMVDTGLARGGGLAWTGVCPPPPCGSEDLSDDGTVDFADLLRVLAAFGDCPQSSECPEPGSCDGGFDPGCAGDPACSCVRLFDGTSQCHRDFGCFQECPDGACPPGFHCVRDSCCGETTCVPDETICGVPGTACFEDLNGDGAVDFADVLDVLAAWGPCSPPAGACCFGGTFGCLEGVMRDACEGKGGDYLGDGSTCDDGCVGLGACCLPDGSCLDGVEESLCASFDGDFQGVGSLCPEVDCE